MVRRRVLSMSAHDLWVLEAKIDELRHALEHAVECTSCSDCVRLGQSALDYVCHDDYLEIVMWRNDVLSERFVDPDDAG